LPLIFTGATDGVVVPPATVRSCFDQVIHDHEAVQVTVKTNPALRHGCVIEAISRIQHLVAARLGSVSSTSDWRYRPSDPALSFPVVVQANFRIASFFSSKIGYFSFFLDY
jgi:hypothetical protein